MTGIRDAATESEVVVRDITRDIQSLDHAKKNLIASMNALKRFQMLGTRLSHFVVSSSDPTPDARPTSTTTGGRSGSELRGRRSVTGSTTGIFPCEGGGAKCWEGSGTGVRPERLLGEFTRLRVCCGWATSDSGCWTRIAVERPKQSGSAWPEFRDCDRRADACIPVNAFDQLTRLAKSRRYRETAQALGAVKQLSQFFKPFATVDRIAAVSQGVVEVQGVLRSQIMREFEAA